MHVPIPPGPIDCTKSPDDPSCKVDCTANPSDPSCPRPRQPAVIDISCPPVDCTKTPNDPSCPPPPTCKSDEILVNSKCEKITCPSGEHYDPEQKKCIPNVITCPKGQHYDTNLKRCIPDCPKDQHFDPKLNKCITPCILPSQVSVAVPCIQCPEDQHYDYNQKKCIPDKQCPPGFHLENKVCTKTITKRVTTVGTVFRNIFPNPNQPSFLLLLNTAQLCQIAGDTQCVAKQNQFNTLNLITKLDSTTKIWSITGQVENRVSKTQNNVRVLGTFMIQKEIM
jgi:hypothetical protein